MKTLSKSQLIGQRGELLVAERTLAMGLPFHALNRLETGIDGVLELRDPVTGHTLAKWIGAQIKTTEAEAYAYEDDRKFEFLLNQNDLDYWRGANIPLIIVLVRLNTADMYWKAIDTGSLSEPRRLHFDKSIDRFDRDAADRVAALCVDRNQLGSYVPPMCTGEPVHLTMLRTDLPERIFVAASLYGSGRDATRELAKFGGHAPFDWPVYFVSRPTRRTAY